MADLNWDTLAERRRKHGLILFFKKMKNGISPEHLTHLIRVQLIKLRYLQNNYYSFPPMCLRCHWNRIVLSHLVSNISINAWSLHQRFTLCTYSRKSPFRKWSPYTRCKFKRFHKSPGIHCRIKVFWRLAIDPLWCVDIYSSGRRVWDNFCAFLKKILILTIPNINVKHVSTILIEI